MGVVRTKIETKVKKQYPPKLFNATQLRIACNKAFGWSLKETDEVMQSLYEHHFMTYPRSSSEYLPESMKEDITVTLNGLFQKHYEKYSVSENERVAYSKRHFDNTKVGSHTAIVPTKTIPTETEWNNLSEKEQKLYDLLAKSIIRIVYSEAVIEETNIDITVDTEIVFSTKATHIQSNGWFVVDSMPQKTDTKPICCEGDILNGTFELKEGKTEPPRRYTQASLVAEMELAGKKIKDEETRALMLKNNCGLGTEATRTAIVQALFKKGYISEKGKSIYPTEKGIYIIDILPIADLKSAEMTGEFEKKLNDIANSCYEYSEYVSVVQDKTQKWFKEIVDKTADSYTAKDELKCPFCKKRMNIFDWGVSCSGYKEGSCDFTLSNKICQKKITQSQMQMLLNSGRTRLIKGFTSKKGELFDAVLVLDNESRKLKFEFPKNKKGK